MIKLVSVASESLASGMRRFLLAALPLAVLAAVPLIPEAEAAPTDTVTCTSGKLSPQNLRGGSTGVTGQQPNLVVSTRLHRQQPRQLFLRQCQYRRRRQPDLQGAHGDRHPGQFLGQQHHRRGRRLADRGQREDALWQPPRRAGHLYLWSESEHGESGHEPRAGRPLLRPVERHHRPLRHSPQPLDRQWHEPADHARRRGHLRLFLSIRPQLRRRQMHGRDDLGQWPMRDLGRPGGVFRLQGAGRLLQRHAEALRL